MQNRNAKALSILMALLVLPEPSDAARRALRPSSYPQAKQIAAAQAKAPKSARKSKRSSLEKLTDKVSAKLSKNKKSKQPAQKAGNIEIVAEPAHKSKGEHVATIELERKSGKPSHLTAKSTKAPLPKLQILEEVRQDNNIQGAQLPPATSEAGMQPIAAAAPAPANGWRGGYHDSTGREDVNEISRRYGVTRQAILRYNRVPDKGPVPEGRRLFVPPATGEYAQIVSAPQPKQPEVPTARPSTRLAPQAVAAAPDDDGPGALDKIKSTVGGVFDGIKNLFRSRGPKRREATNDVSGTTRTNSGYAVPQLAAAERSKPAPSAASTVRPAFQWPVSGQVLSQFGPRRGVPHNGIDISSPKGTPVRAAAAGKVIFSSQMRGYGNVVILDHGNRYFTVYAHNQENLVTRTNGAQPADVKAGQPIALVGDSGNADRPHVHFEVRFENKAIDPMPFLPAGVAAPHAAAPASSEGEPRG